MAPYTNANNAYRLPVMKQRCIKLADGQTLIDGVSHGGPSVTVIDIHNEQAVVNQLQKLLHMLGGYQHRQPSRQTSCRFCPGEIMSFLRTLVP